LTQTVLEKRKKIVKKEAARHRSGTKVTGPNGLVGGAEKGKFFTCPPILRSGVKGGGFQN